MASAGHAAKATNFQLDLAADLWRWRAFLAIGALGSLTRAAIYPECNQSLLSHQISALERDGGGRLLKRTGRGLEPSDLGQRILPQVKALLTDAQRLQADNRGEAREPAGRVTLASLPSIGPALIGPLFARLRQACPGLHLKVREGSSGLPLPCPMCQRWPLERRLGAFASLLCRRLAGCHSPQCLSLKRRDDAH